MIHREMLIDGFFIGGPCDQATGKQVVLSPFDGKLVGTAAEGGLQELRGCVTAAHEAYLQHRFRPAAERMELLKRIADLVRERASELTEILTLEVGKPTSLSAAEVDRLATTFELAARELEQTGREPISVEPDPRGRDFECAVERFPIGVVFCIVPYNWPFNLAAHKIAPALATGNAVVLKTAPQAPLSTLTLARLIHDAGCPPGLLNVWNGPAPLAQKVLLEDRRIKMLSFTGSDKVGWALKEKLPHLKVTLELGGNAFAIVHEDANIAEAAVRLAQSAFAYAGQVCISTQHILIHRDVYATFIDELIKVTRQIVTGDPLVPGTICGPLISSEAVDRVQNLIDDAMQKGAKRLYGGKREGNVLFPTILAEVPSNARIGEEEAFGPVVTVKPYDDFEDALSEINRSSFGIHAAVFTQSADRVERAFKSLEVGGLVVNDSSSVRFDALPYGGQKRSGFGREGVRYAMSEMTEPKSIAQRIQN